jgi:hypothetical protein
MYASYNKQSVGKGNRFTRHEKIPLFGCNEGFIPWLLSKSMRKTQGEPFAWHLEIASALRSLGADYSEANSIVIDIKPSNRHPCLCELTDVFGYSTDDWTPMMWRLRQLRWEEKVDPLDFTAPSDGQKIHSFIHAAGSVRKGKIVGKWIAPKVSSTNSALLWPDALDYFVEQIRNGKSLQAT